MLKPVSLVHRMTLWLKDQLVCSILNHVDCESRLKEENLKLEKAVRIGRRAELVKERTEELQQAPALTVHAVQAHWITKDPAEKDRGHTGGSCRGKQQYKQPQGHSHSNKNKTNSS